MTVDLRVLEGAVLVCVVWSVAGLLVVTARRPDAKEGEASPLEYLIAGPVFWAGCLFVVLLVAVVRWFRRVRRWRRGW